MIVCSLAVASPVFVSMRIARRSVPSSNNPPSRSLTRPRTGSYLYALLPGSRNPATIRFPARPGGGGPRVLVRRAALLFLCGGDRGGTVTFFPFRLLPPVLRALKIE